MEKIVNFWEKLPKSKRPSSKSYASVLSSVNDAFLTAKLCFFSFLASLVEPFLRKYQSDNPLLPFMYNDLKSLVKSVMRTIVKPEELDKCKTGPQLVDMDLDDKKVLMSRKDIQMGYGVEKVLGQLRTKDLVSGEQISVFKKEAQRATVVLLQKLLERTPLRSNFLRCASIFDPAVIVGTSSTVLLKKMKILLLHLMQSNIMSPTDCDKVSAEFRKFLEDDLKKYQLEFKEFNPESKRLDGFFFHDIGVHKYKSLSFVLRLILTMSHGQASVERGFSINNMKPETMVARKIIKDHMVSNKLQPTTIEIDSGLMKAARGAAQKWKLAQEDAKKEKEQNEKDSEKEILTADMEKLKSRCKVMQKAIDLLNKDYDECIERAEKENDMTLVIKGNGLKRKREQTKSELAELQNQYTSLEMKKKKL